MMEIRVDKITFAATVPVDSYPFGSPGPAQQVDVRAWFQEFTRQSFQHLEPLPEPGETILVTIERIQP